MSTTLRMPLRLSKKVRVTRSTVSLWPPVVLGGATYVGHPEHDLLKLDHNLDPVWRIALEGFDVVGGAGEVVVLRHRRDGEKSRGVQSSGTIAWTRDLAPWVVWRDRLIVCAEPGVSLMDAATCRELERIDFGGVVEGRPLGDVLLFRQVDAAEVERAFHLIERRYLWQRNLFEAIQSRFVIWGEKQSITRAAGSRGRFVGGYADHILGFSMEDGEPLWCVPGFVPMGVPLVANGRVHAWTCDKSADYDSYLLCIDEASGDVIYNRPMKPYGEPALLGTNAWPAVLAGDYVVVPVASRFLAAFRLLDGEMVWSYKHPHDMYQPVVDGGRLLVTSSDGNLLVFESEKA